MGFILRRLLFRDCSRIATELQLLDVSFHTDKSVKDFVADLYQQMYEADEVEIKLFGECHRIN